MNPITSAINSTECLFRATPCRAVEA